jgi:arylsulfatase A-like enzyme
VQIVLSKASLLFASVLVLACAESSEVRPNLLLITVDTLRADHVSSYGYLRETTPVIDQVARDGVRFENAFVQRGATWPSMTSILTSMYPRSHGVRGQGDHLDASKRIIAEYLSEAGYETAAFITNMTTVPHRGFAHQETWGLTHHDFSRRSEPDLRATRAARAWLRDRSESPFFVWVHLIGPHDPYEPDPPRPRHFDTGYRGDLDGKRATAMTIHRSRLELDPDELAHIVSLYDEEVSAVDERVAELLEEVDQLGLRDDTLVILTGDHGEELYDHSFYFFHAWSIYESVLHVPLLMRWPGHLPCCVQQHSAL